MTFVSFKDLTKRYTSDGPNAVDHLSFNIEKGEIFSLLGPNGAGKTTAISILSTLLTPTSGEVLLNGHDVREDVIRTRQMIGVVPQDLALYDELNAYENLRFWGEMRGLFGKKLRAEIDEKLNLMELTDRARDHVSDYSGGMKRRLNLAVGLLGSPQLVILDEPTVAIDPQSRRYILDYVKMLNEQGVTVLYTTHYMEEAEELSHRIGIMDHGKLIAIGSLKELTDKVGEHETLTIKLNQTEGGTELAQSIIGLDGIIHASATDGSLIINTTSAQSALPFVMKHAEAQGLSVRTIDIREANLETVFLHLTGRALRD